MKERRMLGLVLIMAILITSIPVAFANGNDEPKLPGFSPGYWKHQIKATVRKRGYVQEENILTFVNSIIADNIGYNDIDDIYLAFTTGNNSEGKWTDLANLFNAAAGYEPYIE